MFLSTTEHPFPHLQGRCVTDTLPGPLRLGGGGREDTVQLEAEGPEEGERGAGRSGQDSETEWGGDTVDELLSKGFNLFGHIELQLGWGNERRVMRKRKV